MTDLTEYAGALLARDHWLRIGVHPRVLAGADMTAVFRGWHTPTDSPASFSAMARRVQKSVVPGGVLSHTTAAMLWGIPLPALLENGVGLLSSGVQASGSDVIPSVLPGTSLRTGATLPMLHVRVEQGQTSGPLRGARVHRWEPGATERWRGLVLSSRCEVLRELATLLPLWDVVAAVDAVVGPKSLCPGITVADLSEHVARMRGRRGVARLRDALVLVRGNSWSPGESIMRLLISGAGLPEPVLNHPVRLPGSGELRYLDLAWPQVRFALEYDGDVHRRTKDQWRQDEARRDEIASLDWTLSRANGDDLWKPLRVLLRLTRSLAARGVRVPDEAHVRRYVAALSVDAPSLRIVRHRP